MHSILAAARQADNRGFANAAFAFAKCARVPLAIAPWLSAASIAAMATMTIVGAFGTAAMPIGLRAGFWTMLIGWNAIKWQGWFALTVRKHADWWRAALIGALLLNLSLPVEIDAFLAVVGFDGSGVTPRIWLEALALSAVLLFIIAVIRRSASGPFEARVEVTRETVASVPPGGLLARAGASPPSLIAIVAEDHYCRVQAEGAADSLIHHRFGDALTEVAQLDGLRVHRGAWVAAAAFVSARRVGRSWRLVLRNGAEVPVSATHLPSVRARGWLRPQRDLARRGGAPASPN